MPKATKAMMHYGIWWNIAGAGWVSRLPDHYQQMEMFPGSGRIHHPKYGGKPLRFSKEEAIRLAEEFSKLGNGSYEAREIK